MGIGRLGGAAVVLLLTFGVCVLVFDRLLGARRCAREPPYIPSAVPYFGHVLGLLRYKMHYYVRIRDKYHLGIYSLAMPAGKLYVVNDPNLILALQRMPKAVSFWPIAARLTANLAGFSNEARVRFLENVMEQDEHESLFVHGLKLTHKALRPGDALDQMTLVAAKRIATALDSLSGKGQVRLDMGEWVRHEITLAATESIYGPSNPFRDAEVERSFWTFSSDVVLLLPGILSSLVARKGYAGRERVVDAFQTYFSSDGHKNASVLIQERQASLESHGIKLRDRARFECVNLLATLVNTIPTTFWTLYNVFSKPSILERVRKEAEQLLTVEVQDDAVHRTLNITKLREVPFLASLLQESIRCHSSGGANWFVNEDVELEGRYLLTKDTFIVIPNRAMHFDQSVWGSTAGDFDAGRFANGKIHPGGFRGFGGGVHWCPGRHFAMTEILTVVVLFALRFDVEPASGQWARPRTNEGTMSLVVSAPEQRVVVDVVTRGGWDGGRWDFV